MTVRRLAFALGLAFGLASCTAPPPRYAALAVPPAAAASAAACQIGPQDGPVAPSPSQHAAARPPVVAAFEVADSGIGGTGGGVGPATLPPVVPAPPTRPTAPVDQGIGGTGTGTAIGSSARAATTGVVGVITGFASICVDGVEVGYSPDTPVVADDTGKAADLRAGQLALVAAARQGGRLQARQLAIRHEVIGPVDSTDTDGMMSIAGQLVQATQQTRGTPAPRLGDWVAVSGLRRPDGVIVASRIDLADPGRVLVHGLLGGDADGPAIGALKLHVPRSIELPPEGAVTATGTYLEGVLYVETLVPDLFQADPSTAFGPDVSDFYVESMAGLGFGGIDYDPSRFGGRAAVLRLIRRPDGNLYGTAALPARGFAPLAPGVAPRLGRPDWQRGGPLLGARRGGDVPGGWHDGFGPGRRRSEAGTVPAPVPGALRHGGGRSGGGGLRRGGGRRLFNGGQAPFPGPGGGGSAGGGQGPPGH